MAYRAADQIAIRRRIIEGKLHVEIAVGRSPAISQLALIEKSRSLRLKFEGHATYQYREQVIKKNTTHKNTISKTRDNFNPKERVCRENNGFREERKETLQKIIKAPEIMRMPLKTNL